MIIGLVLYNRIDYIDKCLYALSKCRYISDYKIVVHIDYSISQSKVENHIYHYFRPLEIVRQSRNVGCNTSIYKTLEKCFEYDDYTLLIEDDILLARDALIYFDQVGKMFTEDKSVFSIDGYNNQPSDTMIGCISKVSSFKPWGWATWKDRWDDGTDSCPKNNWKFDLSPKKFNGVTYTDGTWDCYVKKCVRGDRNRVYPMVPRVKNIGEVGTHTPSKEFHRKKHEISLWSEDFPVTISNFELV